MPTLRTPILSGTAVTPSVADGTLCLASSPRPGVTGGAATASFQVRSMSLTDRLVTAARLAIPHVPADMRGQFAAMLSPEAVATTGGILTAWALSHACGVGEAADLIVAGLGAIFIGWSAVDAAKDLYRYATLAASADDLSQLEAAGQCLARAVAIIGVNTLLVLLAKGAKGKPAGSAGATSEPAPLASRATAMPELSAEAMAFLEGERAGTQGGSAVQAQRRAVLEEWYRNFSKHDHDYTRQVEIYEVDRTTQSSILKEVRTETAAERLASEIDATNLAHEVFRVDFEPGMELIQYMRPGGQTGVYVARVGETADRLAIEGYRVIARFRVTQPFYALESTAAPVKSGRVRDVGGSGGGQQFLMPPHWESFVQRILFTN